MQSRNHVLSRAVLAVLAMCVCVKAAPLAEARVAVMPFSSESLDPRDLMVIAQAVRKAIEGTVKQVVDGANTKRAIQLSGCEGPELWASESCLRMVANQTSAELVLGGTLNQIGSLLEATVSLYGAESGKSVWEMTYKVDGTLEDFYTQVPPKLAGDMPDSYTIPKPPPVKPHVHAHDRKPAAQTQPAAVVQSEEPPASAVTTTSSPPSSAVAPGLVLGVSSLFCMGDPIRTQTPYAFGMHAVYPVKGVGQARLRAAIPMFMAYNAPTTSESGYPDVQLNLEYEWAWPSFGIGVGFDYMYMQWFRLEGSQSAYFASTDDYLAYYDPAHAFNISVSLRGGKPNTAFYGHISWPIPVVFSNGEPNNVFLEYSAFGVFGGQKIKAGLGVMGMYKSRDADYIRHGDSTFNYVDRHSDNDDDWYDYYDEEYNNYSRNEYSQFYAALPCVKVAGLIANHVVLNLTLELGGTILPRIPPDEDMWAPYIGFDVVYSLGRLETVQVFDGTF